ncbi:MAG: NADH-quinone oxidoreductase subunit J [Chloroflexi bacterium]|nr:NADH-quinone oxidoreductase subunit J [Chloroflexota bacterium]
MEFVVFVIAAAVAVAAALMMVLQRNAMYSALFLVLTFFCIAVFYVLLGAFFLAVVQVAVYAGAIMVLMLFVLMLLNVAHPEPADRRLAFLKPFGVIAALVLVIELAVAVLQAPTEPAAAVGGAATGAARQATPIARPAPATPAPAFPLPPEGVGAAEVGHTQALASVLFTRFLLPFEVTSILLLAAILGATVLARKRPETT